MLDRSLTRRQAVVICITVTLTALMCAGMCAAAVIVPAPTAVVPVIAVVSVACPMVGAWQLPAAVAALRRPRGDDALESLRRALDGLPETEHPLGR